MELKLKKLKKMMKEFLKNSTPSQSEIEQFKTLTQAYESIKKQVSRPMNLKPPKIVNIPKFKKVSNFIKKDTNMANVISEMEMNPLFLQMREICGVCA